ncbi:glycoside hydrolase family 66 protein [Paenibacillus beijingensis]|uniref:glycoside hydrolase family 66 protein n=1 Tax=Paenibacillus beijingensis TaxID=1126833 RepID=UPI000697BC9D|nr:glycoside hydrolase family 66 protein [Paenibacillus beijingensis]
MKQMNARSCLALLVSLLLLSGVVPLPAKAAASGMIKRVYTDKARYNPGSSAVIKVDMKNDSGSAYNGSVNLTIHHLETQVYQTSQTVSLSAGASTTVTFNWTVPNQDFKGYFVSVSAGSSAGATAIDVSSKWTRYPRYGYMTEFPVGESSSATDARVKQTVEDYHTNAFQLYDWMWRHENMIKRTNGTVDSSWTDWSGKHTMSWPTIQNLISSMHNYNAAAMPYTMTYAALQDYENISGVSPQWGMFHDNLHQSQLGFDFDDNNPNTDMWLFNPASSGWQNYIFGQYRDIIATAGFDGVHLDQMGERSDPYDYNGGTIDLDKSFSGFINNLRGNLNSNGYADKVITFNNVDGASTGWAFNDVTKNANYDFSYTEIWGHADDYIELKDLIDQGRRNNGQKAMVLAAYMNFEENTGTRYEAESASLNGVNVNTNHPGYTGSGFVDGFGETGDYVQFTISVPEEGWYGLVFDYANDTGTNNSRSLYVDGTFVKQLKYFLDQPNWDTWKFDESATVWLTPGTHTVKLAKEANDTGYINLDSLTLGTFNEPSVRLTQAAIAASGALRIEMGEGDQMLGHPYFPNRAKQMRNSLKEATKDYYNFITAYENLLYDPDVFNNDSGSQFVEIAGQSVSGEGAAGSVWQMMKRSPDYTIVHLINLLNSTDTKWRNSDNAPTTLTNQAVKVYIGGDESISNVYLASPEISMGATQELSFTTGTDSKGKYVSFTLPSLQYWDMVYMKRSLTAPTNDIYEAENAVKVNLGVNTDHSGYTGSGYVDQFADVNDGLAFTVKAATTDDHVLRFRYANGGSDATRDVFVDGVFAGTIGFKGLGDWDTWGFGELTVSLKQGVHTVTLWKRVSNTGAINLDHLDLDKTYVWQFDRQITSVPAGYRVTFRTGASGWVHSGTNNWQNVTDSMMRPNGSGNDDLDYEISVGPFASGTTVDATFLWDDNGNGVLEESTDRWEGTDFHISVE